MKFQAERDVLADAVAWTARALPARPQVPVLAAIRLRAAGDELALSAFDYEVSAKASIPVITDDDEAVLVPGRLLAAIVSALPARPVEVATDGARVEVKCGSSVFTLNTLPTDEYPALPGMPPEAGKVGADLLASAIGQVAVAAGRDDTFPALTGIRVEIDGPRVTLVATDRYRLAVREFQWEPLGPETDAVSLLVPARTLTEAARSFGGSAEVTIGLDAARRGRDRRTGSSAGRRAAGRPQPGSSPASTRGIRRCCPPSSARPPSWTWHAFS